MDSPTRPCPNCGETLPAAARFCGACGQSLPPFVEEERDEDRGGLVVQPFLPGAEAAAGSGLAASAQTGAATSATLPAGAQAGSPTEEKGAQEGSSDEKIQALLKRYQDRIEQARKERFTFLLMGRTGVGKSSSVNSLMNQKVAPVGDWEPTTMSVDTYKSEAFGIKYDVIDTPGLCDDLPEKLKDEEYLSRIRVGVPQVGGKGKVDCLWFVTKLGEKRVTGDEKRAIKLVTEGCGKEIWERAIIVFTFANDVQPVEKYKEALKVRTGLIRLEIASHVGSSIAGSVPSVAIDNEAKTTPDGEEWLAELYVTVFNRMSEHGFWPFLLSTIERVVLPPTPSYSHSPSYPPSGGGYSPYVAVRRSPSPSKGSSTPSPAVNSTPPSPPAGAIKLTKPEHIESVKNRLEQNFIAEATAAGVTVGATIGVAIAGPLGAVIGGVAGGVIGGIFGFFGRKKR